MVEHFFLQIEKESKKYVISVTCTRHSFHAEYDISILSFPDFELLGSARLDLMNNHFETREDQIAPQHHDLFAKVKGYLLERRQNSK